MEPPEALRIELESAGVAEIGADEIGTWWPRGWPETLRLTSAGREVPYLLHEGALIFALEAPGAVRADRAAGGPLTMARSVDSGKPRVSAPLATVRHERDLVFDRLETARLSLMDASDAPRYWVALADACEIRFRESGRRGGQRLRVRLQSMRTAGVEHTVRVVLNGKELGRASWRGGKPHTAEFEGVAMPDGESVLVLSTQDAPVPRVIASGPIDRGPVAYLDWVEVSGPRTLGGGQAAWDGSQAVDASEFRWVFDLGTSPSAGHGAAYVEFAGPCRAATELAARTLPRRISPAPSLDPGPAADWLVVAPRAFEKSLAPLVARRAKQGRTPRFRAIEDIREAACGRDSEGAVRDFLRAAAAAWTEPKLRWVLLVGDATRLSDGGVPCGHADALGAGWTATDGFYARTDEDDLPDLAVGRWPARTPEEAAALCEKVARAEDAGPGEWRRRIYLTLGTAGFGKQMDDLLKSGGLKIASDFVPNAYAFRVQSSRELGLPFTWPHDEYNGHLTERVNEGCLVFAYSGHGWEHGLQTLRWEDKRYPILDAKLAADFDVKEGLPVMVFFACLTGSFDEKEDCLAEACVRNPRGAAAVIASSGISHPYADMIFAKELMGMMFAKRAPTIGEAVMAAKRRCIKPAENDTMRQFIDGMAAGSVGGPEVQARYRRDGTLAYNLLGDPALRLNWPKKVEVEAPKEAAPAAKLEVSGRAELGDGTAMVTFEAERLKTVEKLEEIDPEKPDRDALKRNWARMNEPVAARATVSMKAGAFSATLPLPEALPEGDYHVKVYASDGTADAIASKKVRVAKK
jgi:hypothetical protein